MCEKHTALFENKSGPIFKWKGVHSWINWPSDSLQMISEESTYQILQNLQLKQPNVTSQHQTPAEESVDCNEKNNSQAKKDMG